MDDRYKFQTYNRFTAPYPNLRFNSAARVCVAVLNANFLEVMLSVSKQLIAVKAQSVMEGIQFVQELEHHLITLFVKRKAEHV